MLPLDYCLSLISLTKQVRHSLARLGLKRERERERESGSKLVGGRERMWKSEKNKQVKAFVHAAIYTSIIPLC